MQKKSIKTNYSLLGIPPFSFSFFHGLFLGFVVNTFFVLKYDSDFGKKIVFHFPQTVEIFHQWTRFLVWHLLYRIHFSLYFIFPITFWKKQKWKMCEKIVLFFFELQPSPPPKDGREGRVGSPKGAPIGDRVPPHKMGARVGTFWTKTPILGGTLLLVVKNWHRFN